MSSYYDYREVKVMIARKLMNMEGWSVYGYHEDESDLMSDYWSPAYWDGVAEKKCLCFMCECLWSSTATGNQTI